MQLNNKYQSATSSTDSTTSHNRRGQLHDKPLKQTTPKDDRDTYDNSKNKPKRKYQDRTNTNSDITPKGYVFGLLFVAVCFDSYGNYNTHYEYTAAESFASCIANQSKNWQASISKQLKTSINISTTTTISTTKHNSVNDNKLSNTKKQPNTEHIGNVNISIENERENSALFYKCVFTKLNGKGRKGPTILGQYYKNQSHVNDVYLIAVYGLQIWKVPYSGWYLIVAYGAQGGNNTYVNSNANNINNNNNNISSDNNIIFGGKGAKIGGLFQLEKGDEIGIAVGQCGESSKYDILTSKKQNATVYSSSAGGGATFVTKCPTPGNHIYACSKYSHTPVLVAAGGHGIPQIALLKPNGHKNFDKKSLKIYDGMAVQFDNRSHLFNGYISDGRAGHGGSFEKDSHLWTTRYGYDQCHGFSFMHDSQASLLGGYGIGVAIEGGFGGGGGAGDVEAGAGGGYIGGIVQGINSKFDKNTNLNGALSYNSAKYYSIMESGVNIGDGKVEIEYKGKINPIL